MTGFKISKQFLLFFTGIFISFHCLSQSDSTQPNQTPTNVLMPVPPPMEEIFYKGSFEGGAGAIVPLENKALRLSLNGIYDIHLSGNYVFAPHLFIGLYFQDAELGNIVQNQPYNTIMTMYNLGVKVGYYTYMKSDFLFCYSLTGGPSLIKYTDALVPAPQQQSFFVTPDLLAAYRVNDELRVGVDISILLLGYRFDPTYTGIAHYIIYNTSKDTKTLTTCATLGFGVYWAFDEGKK